MTISASGKLREIAEQTGNDPRGAMLRIIGDFSDYDVGPQKLLVMTYIRPEKTRGGIYRTDQSLAEDRFQGKVGLVLKVGPLAFEDDGIHRFGGFTVKEGDWVQFRPSDGTEFFHVTENGRDGVPCRLLSDTHILGKPQDPEKVF